MVSISFSENDAPGIADEVTALLGRAIIARLATDVVLAEARERLLERDCELIIRPITRSSRSRRASAEGASAEGANAEP
jgi:hypothetical protein